MPCIPAHHGLAGTAAAATSEATPKATSRGWVSGRWVCNSAAEDITTISSKVSRDMSARSTAKSTWYVPSAGVVVGGGVVVVVGGGGGGTAAADDAAV